MQELIRIIKPRKQYRIKKGLKTIKMTGKDLKVEVYYLNR